MKSTIQNFTDLVAWKEAHELAVMMYRVTGKFPKEEQFGIVNQMRRAAVSVLSNIAEGFSRNSVKEKIQFYSIAKGSLAEIESQLFISRDVGYISHEIFNDVYVHISTTNKLINGLISHLRSTY